MLHAELRLHVRGVLWVGFEAVEKLNLLEHENDNADEGYGVLLFFLFLHVKSEADEDD